MGFPGDSDSKEPSCNAGDPVSVPGLGRSPGEGNGCPLQYSYLENSMNKGAWGGYGPKASKELDMTERLSLSLFFPGEIITPFIRVRRLFNLLKNVTS